MLNIYPYKKKDIYYYSVTKHSKQTLNVDSLLYFCVKWWFTFIRKSRMKILKTHKDFYSHPSYLKPLHF